jgi:hypothetical protein
MVGSWTLNANGSVPASFDNITGGINSMFLESTMGILVAVSKLPLE